MLKTGAIFFMLTIACIHGYGQRATTISGVVRDRNGVGLDKATILLLSSIDTFRVLSAEDGGFIFHISHGVDWELKVSIKGYKTYRTSFSIDPARQSLILSPIVLSFDYEELVPVMVIKTKPITALEDTVEYHAAAYELQAGSELERLMKRLPGIDWDTGGNILIEGKKVRRIMINGQDFMGGDIKTALHNLPADIIEKVQVIDDYGDKARLTGVKSGEGEKVLNIVTRKDKRSGGVANLELGGGNQGRYVGKLFTNVFHGDRQLSLNSFVRNNSNVGNKHEEAVFLGYSDKWTTAWSGGGGLIMSRDDQSYENSITEDDYFSSNKVHQEQRSQTTGSSRNIVTNYTLKYIPDRNTTLRIYSLIGFHRDQQSLSKDFSNQDQDTGFMKTAKGNSLIFDLGHSLTAESNLYYEKTYPHSKNRISFEASYQYSSGRISEDNSSHSDIQTDSLTNSSLQHYLLHTANSSQNLTTKFNYYTPLGKVSLLELGYSWSVVSTKNSRLVQVPDSTNSNPGDVDSLGNAYSIQTIVNQVHAGYLAHLKKMNLSLILNAQPGVQEGRSAGKSTIQHYSYFNFLPQVQISYAFSLREKLNFEYSSKSSPPQMQELNPVLDLSNPQYPSQGNPNLKPSFMQSVSLRYEQSALQVSRYRGFGLGFSYESSENMIAANTLHPRDTTSTIQKITYVNVNGSHSFRFDYRWNVLGLIKNKFRITLNGNIIDIHTPTVTDNILYLTNSLSWLQNLQITLNIPDIIESSMNGSYSRSVTQYSRGGKLSYSTSSFNWLFNSRHVFFRRWTLACTASQLFTSRIGGSLQANPALINVSMQRDILPKHQARVSFSVNDLFNSSTSVTQSITPTSIIQSHNNLIGRYFLLSLILKLEKFR